MYLLLLVKQEQYTTRWPNVAKPLLYRIFFFVFFVLTVMTVMLTKAFVTLRLGLMMKYSPPLEVCCWV